MNVVGLDLGHTTTREAEHWLAVLPPVPGLVACTHLVHGPRPRVVITLFAPVGIEMLVIPTAAMGEDTGGDAAAAAAADHVAGRAGRAVVYPGVRSLTGSVTVAELLAGSAIDRVRVIGGADPRPRPDTVVDTRDFVRPQWMDGQLTLIATPAPHGRIAPFEVPNPTPCCGDHY